MADNKSIQKVFGLSDFRKKQLLGEIPEKTRETYREYGYFGGGFSPSTSSVSSVERIDFSNDTVNASVRGPLAATKYSHGATSNNDFGYFGVAGPAAISSFHRINYSNDTQQASVRGSFSTWRRYITAAAGNLNFGYYAGGFIPIPTPINVSTVDRIDYSNDLATTSVRNPLSQQNQLAAATGNSNFGWFGGGVNSNIPASYSTVERINYSNDLSLYFIRGPLTLARSALSATGNSNFGYFGGGNVGGTIIDRINYSNDLVAASARTFLPQIKNFLSAAGNSNFGYFGPGASSPISTIDRLDYANDTATTTVRGAFNTPKAYSAATSSHSFGGTPNSSFASNFTFPTVPNAGYFGGGFDGTNLATIDKVDYANDTATASVRSALSSAKNGTAGTGNNNFGYFGGGAVAGPTFYSTVDRLEYASDTQNTITRGPLSVARSNLSATGNSNFGYFGGGYIPGTPGASSTVDRIDYSTDTSAASARGLLILDRYGPGATGNQNFGYFAGGISPSESSSNAKSEIQRIDYSADLATALNRSTLTGSRYVLAATGNTNFGYFGGGHFPASVSFSNIQRLDYSNDTQTSINRGNLSTARGRVSATGTSSFGFFGSGTTIGNPSGNISTTDRIDYSNDTAVASARGPLSTAKSLLAATSPLAYGGAPIYFTNPLPEVLQKQIEFDDSNTLDLPFKRVLGSYGYFGGGGPFDGPYLSTVSRVDYSSDTSVSSVRGALSIGRAGLMGIGNKNYGYYAGRWYNNTNILSQVDRIDYSNDSAIALVRGFMSQSYPSGPIGRGYGTSTGNSNYGYMAGGATGPTSRIDRIDYSNDNQTMSIRGSFSTGPNSSSAGIENKQYGWLVAGNPFNSGISTIQRINFNNDLTNTNIRGTLSYEVTAASRGVSNETYGWVAGGNTPAGNTTNISRVDFSNDLSIASVRSLLNTSRQLHASTGNSNFGYFGGGEPVVSSVERLDFANDTTNPSIRGPLAVTTGRLAATTNARNS